MRTIHLANIAAARGFYVGKDGAVTVNASASGLSSSTLAMLRRVGQSVNEGALAVWTVTSEQETNLVA